MFALAALVVLALSPGEGLLQVKPEKPRDDSTLVKVADNAKLPHLTLDGDGNAYIAFARNGNIELSSSTDGGKTFSPPVTARTDPTQSSR